MNNTQKVLKNKHICEQATPNLGITQSSGLDRHAVCYSTDDLYTCEPAGDKDLPFLLIRRLTPLECERLQGFPDGWTDIPGASDSARYKALGNSVYWDKAIMLMVGTKMA